MWSEAKEHADLDARYRSVVAASGTGFWQGKLYDMGQGKEFTSVYTKGPAALHALRRLIGDKAFDRLLHDWAAQHRDGNASSHSSRRWRNRIPGNGSTDSSTRGSAAPRNRPTSTSTRVRCTSRVAE